MCVRLACRVAGLSSGTDTFSGQAFGAGQVKLVGVYLQVSPLRSFRQSSHFTTRESIPVNVP